MKPVLQGRRQLTDAVFNPCAPNRQVKPLWCDVVYANAGRADAESRAVGARGRVVQPSLREPSDLNAGPSHLSYRTVAVPARLITNHMALAKRTDLPEGERHRGTLVWAFKNVGYTTTHFGKWHLGGNIALPGLDPERTVQESRNARPFGFDRSVVW